MVSKQALGSRMEGQRPDELWECALGYLLTISSVPEWLVGIHTGRPPNHLPPLREDRLPRKVRGIFDSTLRVERHTGFSARVLNAGLLEGFR